MRGPQPAPWFIGDGCTFSPDGLHGVNWVLACRFHDWAYRCDTPISRWQADCNFFHNLRECGCPLRWAVIYFLAVRLCGWRYFNRKWTLQ